MAILQCNKCTNLFHDDAPHECGVERWQRLANEAQQAYERAINSATKSATPQPPEWKVNCAKCLCGAGIHVRGCPKREPEMSPLDRALSDFTARRKAKRENVKPRVPDPGKPDPTYRKDMDALARALSTPLPHDPPMSARLMPWRGK